MVCEHNVYHAAPIEKSAHSCRAICANVNRTTMTKGCSTCVKTFSSTYWITNPNQVHIPGRFFVRRITKQSSLVPKMYHLLVLHLTRLHRSCEIDSISSQAGCSTGQAHQERSSITEPARRCLVCKHQESGCMLALLEVCWLTISLNSSSGWHTLPG